MWFLKKFKLCKPVEEGESGGSAAPEIDMSAAADSISESLFGVEEKPAPAPDELELEEPETTAAGTPPPKPEGTESGTPPADPPAPAKLEAPNTWRPEAKAEWDKLPPAAQAEILKREEDVFRGIEGYRQQANVGKTFENLLSPYQQLFQQQGQNVFALTQDFLVAHASMSIGTPEQKLGKLMEIAKAYNIELPSGAPTDPENAPYIDPQVKALQQQLASVQSQLAGTATKQQEIDAREQERVRAGLRSEIDTFAADPANIYFEECGDQIVALLQSGTAKNLKDAYDQAVWLNPVTREKEVLRKTAEQAAKAREEARARAKAAQSAAAANVRTSAKQASGTTLLGSIDDTLKEEYRKLTAG